jgi:hypothetical protein
MSTPLVYAIDPGTTESALVVYNPNTRYIHRHVTEPNASVLEFLEHVGRDMRSRALSRLALHLVVEQIESFGMAVGKETFETVWWAGRFHQAWGATGLAHRVTRREVKLHLCASARAKDANIRQAILDRFGGSAAIGRKHAAGPLYGMKGHEFAALAVALTFTDTVLAKESHAQPALV